MQLALQMNEPVTTRATRQIYSNKNKGSSRIHCSENGLP